jgi:hypothetical protein
MVIMSKPERPALKVRAPKDVDEFVAGGASTNASAQAGAVQPPPSLAPAPPAPSGRKMRGLVRRADGWRMRITVYVAPDVGERFKRHCEERGVDVSDGGAEVVTTFVKSLTVAGDPPQ